MFMAPLLLLLFSFFASSHAVILDLKRRAASNPTSIVVADPANANRVGFSDAWSTYGIYSVTVYVQGYPYQVQLDTGSSDLWLDTSAVSLAGLVDTGHNATIVYGDTTVASGPIVMGNVSLGEYTVEEQAFINAIGTNASLPGADVGLLGIGPPFNSRIRLQLLTSNSSYNPLPFLSNVFDYYPDEQTFITLLLTRSNVGITEGGVFSISELVADYTSILDAPKLPVVSDQAFLSFMDGIYVNGEFFTGHSVGVENAGMNAAPGPNQISALFDSGTTLIRASPYYVDAIYKNLPGAQYNDTVMAYQVPCSTKLNISMKFGDAEYPMDPIDATVVNVNSDGTFQCFGAFEYNPEGSPFDFILGDSFLRNVYSLYYYGNWTKASVNKAPYVQLLSLTDPDQAWADFDVLNSKRIGEMESAAMQANANITTSYAEAAPMSITYSLVSPPAATPAVISASITASPSEKAVKKLGADLAEASAGSSPVDLSGLTRNSYIIMGLIGSVLVLLLGVLVKLVSDGRNAQYRAVPDVMRPPVEFHDKPYEPDAGEFTTPYDDPVRQV